MIINQKKKSKKKKEKKRHTLSKQVLTIMYISFPPY